MDVEKICYELFGKKQEKKVDLYLPEIIEALNKQKNKAIIDTRGITQADVKAKIENPNYLEDEYLNYIEGGIKILYATPKVAEMIKKHIPRTIKELTIPIEFMQDLTFLQQFPQLETIHISNYSTISHDEIEFIEQNTSVRNITLLSTVTIDALRGKNGYNVIESGNRIAQYGKLTLYQKGYKGEWKGNLKVYTSDYNDQNLAIIEAMYQGISDYLPEISTVSLFKDSQNIYDPEFMMNLFDGKIQNMTIKNVTPTEAAKVYKQVIKNKRVKEVKYRLKNKTYEDIYQLKQIANNSDLRIAYENSSNTASYEEFVGMRKAIDYYKELIATSGLSPVEEIAYVYDILKTMRYHENEKNKLRPRNIHSIVADGDIVCVGYSEFAVQLLKEVGIRCIGVSCTCLNRNSNDRFHERNIVRLDDDKYNIHGLYALDITWDSDKNISVIKEDGTEKVVSMPHEVENEKVIDKYDSLILYRHFLIPLNTYEQRYPNEINPKLYEIYKNDGAKHLVEESRKVSTGQMSLFEVKNLYILNQHQELFDLTEGPLTVKKYFSANKPSLETFEEILTNVRMAQGYTEEAAEKDVDRVVELHQMLADQNPNSPNNFFKPKAK